MPDPYLSDAYTQFTIHNDPDSHMQGGVVFSPGDAVELLKQPGEANTGIAVIQAIWEDKPTHGEVKQQASCRRYYRADVRQPQNPNLNIHYLQGLDLQCI